MLHKQDFKMIGWLDNLARSKNLTPLALRAAYSTIALALHDLPTKDLAFQGGPLLEFSLSNFIIQSSSRKLSPP